MNSIVATFLGYCLVAWIAYKVGVAVGKERARRLFYSTAAQDYLKKRIRPPFSKNNPRWTQPQARTMATDLGYDPDTGSKQTILRSKRCMNGEEPCEIHQMGGSDYIACGLLKVANKRDESDRFD